MIHSPTPRRLGYHHNEDKLYPHKSNIIEIVSAQISIKMPDNENMINITPLDEIITRNERGWRFYWGYENKEVPIFLRGWM